MKTSYILMIITILSKVFGLLREKALAYFFGVGMVADIFLIAFQLPMTFTNVISGA
ncbi:MAG: murein biosynthesis integral membrane protein MurJ, partial [Anaerococcus vaginalis]|nr:murein biosynthesis integral membrane protein MurJ [Anaerococcus vaginalis]